MALLNKRQETAEALARCAWCVSPMPLHDDSRLRFQVLDKDRDAVLEKLSSRDWSTAFVGTHPRIDSGGCKLASVYEIDLPRERMPVPPDIAGELSAGPKEINKEVAGLRIYMDSFSQRKRSA